VIPTPEIPAALRHVAAAAHRRVLVVGATLDADVEKFVRASVGAGVRVDVRRHPHMKALIADESLALLLSTSMTGVGTGVGFEPEFDGHEPNIESALLIDEPREVAALLGAATGRR